MKIVWNKNPLRTSVELENDLEREMFKLRIEIDAYRWAVAGAHFHLEGKHGPVDVKRALEDLWVKDKKKLKESVEKSYEEYLGELQGVHVGDCTCVPCSCSKCMAEAIAGVNTIAGLYKHCAYKIDQAISRDPSASHTEILESLANPDYSKPNEHYRNNEALWFSAAPRWTEESKQAHDWLKKYYESHPEALSPHQ